MSITEASNGTLHWSDESHGLLLRLWREGLPKKEIAAQLGRTVPAIERKASTLNLPRRGYLKRDDKQDLIIKDVQTEADFRRAAHEGLINYIRAYLKAGGQGGWGGHLSSVEYQQFNSTGSSR